MNLNCENYLADAILEIENAQSLHDLKSVKSRYLGKNGIIRAINIDKSLDLNEKKLVWSEINNLISAIECAYKKKELCFSEKELVALLDSEYIDVTLPSRSGMKIGSPHVLHTVIEQIVSIFNSMGFVHINGDDIDSEYYLFDALNTPSHHPARQMQDTFFLKNGSVLRPHTSSSQIHSLEKIEPPLAVVSSGRVYRNDWDATHSPMFHQVEGMFVAEKVSMSNMKYVISKFIDKFFAPQSLKIRFRPSFFPFTEPSSEVDIMFNDSWFEVMGCGIINRNVLENCDVDPDKYSGFAFGLGVERFAMLKYNVKDLRLFFENNVKWLSNF